MEKKERSESSERTEFDDSAERLALSMMLLYLERKEVPTPHWSDLSTRKSRALSDYRGYIAHNKQPPPQAPTVGTMPRALGKPGDGGLFLMSERERESSLLTTYMY